MPPDVLMCAAIDEILWCLSESRTQILAIFVLASRRPQESALSRSDLV